MRRPPPSLLQLTCIAQFHPKGADGWFHGSKKKADLAWVRHGGKRYEEGSINMNANNWKKLILEEEGETVLIDDDDFTEDGEGKEGGAAGSSSAPAGTTITDFSILAVLGRGGYGKVLQVKHQRPDGTLSDVYAMKVLHKREVVKRHQVGRTHVERKIMSLIVHPFIVNLKFSFQSPTKLYMVMEFAPGGDFFTHLHRDGPLCEGAARLYCAQLALALQHLHTHRIIYRDLKPENVLLDRAGNVKLVDFGLSRLFGMNDRKTAPGYVAPATPGSEARATSTTADMVTYSFCGTEQ